LQERIRVTIEKAKEDWRHRRIFKEINAGHHFQGR
jgi:hypothetical protein